MLDAETLQWLDEVEKKYGKDIRNDRQTYIEWYLQSGLDNSGAIPNLKPEDVPRMIYNGMVVVPNGFNIGDKVTAFYTGWNITDDGEIVDIKWRETMIGQSPFRSRFEPHYKILLEDGSIAWRFEDSIGGVISVRQDETNASAD